MTAHGPSLRVLSASVAAAVVTAGCTDVNAPAERKLVLDGWLERGAIVRPIAVVGSDSIAPISLTFSPSNAAEVVTEGIKLLVSGPLAVTATLPDNSSLTSAVTVNVPPAVLFDMSVDGNRDIYRVALDGADLQRLTTNPGDDADPTAAASTIIFVSRRSGNADLYALSQSGGVENRLTTTAVNETQPELSADASHVVYIRDDGGLPRVWAAAASGADAARVTQTFGSNGTIETSPTMSRAGDSIVFTATADGTANLFVTTSSTTPTRLLPASSDSARVEAAWSPDGKHIAYVAAAAAGASQLFLLDLTTRSASRLTNDSFSVGQPAWLSDGRLLFTRFGTRSDLCWLDPATPARVFVVPTPGADAQHPHATS